MPALSPTTAAMPSPLSLLLTGAAAPAAVTGEGAPADFAAMLAGVTPSSAPGPEPLAPAMPMPTGNGLPVILPELAGPVGPEAGGDADVAAIMVGSGWMPAPKAALPVIETPEAEASSPESQLTVEPEQPATLPRPSVMPVAVQKAPPQMVAKVVKTIEPELADEDPAEPKAEAGESLPLRLPLTPTWETQAPAVSFAAPPPPTVAHELLGASADETAPAIAFVSVPRPQRLAPLQSAAAAAPISAPSPAPAPTDPAIAAPDIPLDGLPIKTQLIQPVAEHRPAAPAELRIAPEIARQVAQMIQPAVPTGEPRAPELAASAELQPVTQPGTLGLFQATAPAPAATLGQPAPVDLGRAEWMQAMIDRIAELPQSEGRREAQIRLLPDALGAVEVRIFEQDEQMHVTLNTDNAQARQLITDAAPRLHELAEARGLRLAQPEVSGGQPQDRRPAQDQQPAQTSTRPRPAQGADDDSTTTEGDRIA